MQIKDKKAINLMVEESRWILQIYILVNSGFCSKTEEMNAAMLRSIPQTNNVI